MPNELNTDHLIAALTDAIESRKRGLEAPARELDDYRKRALEVEHELRTFIESVVADK